MVELLNDQINGFNYVYKVAVILVKCSDKKICLEVLKNDFVRSFFQPALLVREFSSRILLFALIELDLPIPVSHPPSHGTHPRPTQLCGVTHKQNVFASPK
jgi:hypothetical protein